MDKTFIIKNSRGNGLFLKTCKKSDKCPSGIKWLPAEKAEQFIDRTVAQKKITALKMVGVTIHEVKTEEES